MKLTRFILTASAWLALTALSAWAAQRQVPGQYAKISLAVAAASAGDSIIVASGFFNIEDTVITVDKALTITGGGYRNLNNGGTHVNKGFLLAPGADNTVISGFRLVQPSVSNVFIRLEDGCDNITLSDLAFRSTSTNIWAVATSLTNRLTVKNCILQNASLQLLHADRTKILNNVFAGGTYYSGNTETAIYTNGSADLVVMNNLIGEINYNGYCIYYIDANDLYTSVITGNIFYSSNHICNPANQALLYANNRKWNVSGTEPSGGTDNTSGDPYFTVFDIGTGFVYEDSASIDSDVRLQVSPNVSPCIDAGYPPITPLDFTYRDLTGQGGLGNSSSDIGVFGGPYPLVSPFAPPTIPTVTGVTMYPDQVSPSGSAILYVNGAIGTLKKEKSRTADQTTVKE